MANSNESKKMKITRQVVAAGQQYLSQSGALEEPSLVGYPVFVKHMLETTVEKSGDVPFRVTEDMQNRAVEYFLKYIDPDAAIMMTYRDFVDGLLTYAILGVETNKVN